jgi:predicted nucleotidyltransferase
MDARPLLALIAAKLAERRLEAILIGNAAAALHGAPVTTVDLDFLFRNTPANQRKLQQLAKDLDAVRPFHPASGLLRLVRKDGLQLDFMQTIHGVKSLASLRSRARQLDFDGSPLLVADLSDIIKSKKEAGRATDRAVLGILEKTLARQKADQPNTTARSLKKRD